jgi:hypothetical protein
LFVRIKGRVKGDKKEKEKEKEDKKNYGLGLYRSQLMSWNMTQNKYTYKPLGNYGEVERLYKEKIKEKEKELEGMRLKKEKEEEQRQQAIKNELRKKEEEQRQHFAAIQAAKCELKKEKEEEQLQAGYRRLKKEKEEEQRQAAKCERLKVDFNNKLFESSYGSEDQILQNKKVEKKYLFIYQIEEEGLETEELTESEIEERLDKFALSSNNYVIITNGKVVEFPLSNNLKP